MARGLTQPARGTHHGNTRYSDGPHDGDHPGLLADQPDPADHTHAAATHSPDLPGTGDTPDVEVPNTAGTDQTAGNDDDHATFRIEPTVRPGPLGAGTAGTVDPVPAATVGWWFRRRLARRPTGLAPGLTPAARLAFGPRESRGQSPRDARKSLSLGFARGFGSKRGGPLVAMK